MVARGAPARTKSALSQVVAAMLGRAGTGWVPTQGRLIRPITGRSAAASVPGVSPDGGGSTGAARTAVGHGPDGSEEHTLRTASVSVVTARSTATGSTAERLRDRRDGEGAGAGQAHDVGAAYGVGDAQLEHLRLVAETLHPVGVRAAAAAPGCTRRTSPAWCGRRCAEAFGDREISTVCTTRRRFVVGTVGGEGAHHRALAARVGEPGRLAHRVDPAAGGVVGGRRPAASCRAGRAAAPAGG